MTLSRRSACIALIIALALVCSAEAVAQTEYIPTPQPIPNFDRQFPPAEEVGVPGPSGLPEAKPLVVEVRIVGNEAIREEKIQSYLKTRKDREFDPETVKADVRKLATTGLFRDVKPFTQPTPQGMIVTFQVAERPSIRHIRFIGNRGFSDRKLTRETGIKVGDALNHYAVEEARRKVEEFYRSRGFTQAQIDIHEGKGTDDHGVVLYVAEGPLIQIAKVEFVGNTIASDGRLKTQIDSKPGFFGIIGLFRGKLDRTKLEEDEEKLLAYYRSLGYFRARLGCELKIDSSGKSATLTFVVDEGPRYVIRNVSVAGNEVFGSPDLLTKLELQSNQHFNQAKMNRDVEQLRDVYGGQGYVFANVKADPVFLEEPGQLDLVYHVEEGEQFRAGKIHVNITGDYPHTRDMVVLNRVSVTPGEILDIREIRASERRLKAAQLFEDEQTGGQPPRIAVRPPELDSVSGLANRPKPRTTTRTTRGQSPDPSRAAR